MPKPDSERLPRLSQTRRFARQRALQALYQQALNPLPVNELLAEFIEGQSMGGTDLDYFNELVKQSVEQADALDQKLAPFLDKSLAILDPVEHSILRLSAYELLHRADIPYRVVINEAISLAKRYGASESHKFINGVLDKLAAECRPSEGRGK